MPAVAENVVVVAPAGTVTEAGTVNVALVLERVIAAPPLGAADDKVTVHVDIAPVPRLAGTHTNELIAIDATREILTGWELPL